jgi:hypothetical protein
MYDTTNEHSKIYGFDAQRPLYVQTIFVSKEHRGKGIGSKVMEYIVDYANQNGHDVIFGNITQKAEPSIDVIKSMIVKSGFNTCEGNNDFYKIINNDDSNYAEGGEVDYKKKTYAKWKSLVNMSSSELERFYNSQEGKDAGLSTKEANEQGISSGRESARWAMKMKNTKVSDWTPTMWKWANKQISFISRMSGNKGGLYDDKGNKTRKHTSLLIWGNNPEKESSMKYENGGEMDVRMEDTVQRMDNPNFADISYYNNGGEINNQKNTNIMETYKFNEMPLINTISDNDLILIKEEVFSGDIDKPMHKGTRYVSCKVMSKGVMVDSLNLKVIKSVGANSLSAGQNITRPIANLISNGRKMVGSFKDGGELNPDNKVIKQYFAHDSGNAGGVLVGKRHSEGGIKATNNSTGQPIEMEGGEVVITRGAVSNPKKYNFNGKELTTREILSNLNVDGGGVSFAEGGDVPESINCSCSQMDLGGKLITPKEFIELSEKEFNESNNEAIRN